MNKKLKNLIALSCNVKVYVPSTINVSTCIDTSKHVDSTLSFLSGIFGGATSYDAYGCWNSADQGLIKEHIVICESYCNSEQLKQNIDSVVEYCEALKKELLQEAIALEVNNNLYFI